MNWAILGCTRVAVPTQQGALPMCVRREGGASFMREGGPWCAWWGRWARAWTAHETFPLMYITYPAGLKYFPVYIIGKCTLEHSCAPASPAPARWMATAVTTAEVGQGQSYPPAGVAGTTRLVNLCERFPNVLKCGSNCWCGGAESLRQQGGHAGQASRLQRFAHAGPMQRKLW